ncbi:hypothetical protein T10_7606 [Trichinella papuae]|uniref:Uncharacterized protein n=1 Tax=Trichinella papuae TaxID=268474 RepID=A0A0V1M1N9_9BILA|nr:hypothetical protein T10_7606 [Trichinella papuae]
MWNKFEYPVTTQKWAEQSKTDPASEQQHLDIFGLQVLFSELKKYCLHAELSSHQDWVYKLNANLASMK